MIEPLACVVRGQRVVGVDKGQTVLVLGSGLSGLLNIQIDAAGAMEIARRSRGTPRIANRLLRRVRDFAEVEHDALVSRDVAHAALIRLDVDEIGLDYMDTKLLTTLIDKFGGGVKSILKKTRTSSPGRLTASVLPAPTGSPGKWGFPRTCPGASRRRCCI